MLGVPAAWAYSRFNIPAKKDQLFFILSTRFMPPVVVVIPIFLMFRDLDLLDTLQGLILVYSAFNLPFTIWMMKGFIDEVPAEYEEAAMLDGYSRFEAFWRVTMPLLIPGIAATAVFALIFSWNEFVFSIFLITDPEHAHRAVRDRGPDRRHDDRLGAGRRLGDGLRDPGAAVRLPRAQAPRRRRDARGGASLMAEVLVKSLHKAFPDGTVAVEELDLDDRATASCSSCSARRAAARRRRCAASRASRRRPPAQIVIGDEVVSGLRPSQRDIAMVFQFYALYPHLSVRDNMAFPLRAAKAPESEINERVNEAARMLQLEPYLTRKPNKLSGGEQQRVALGRAMVRHPKAFLMDEPLTNLDAELRADMRAELKHVQQRLNTTMIYVTHDQTEAMALGHRIAILNKGRLEQLGAPMEVYDRPATLFAARFIGSPPMNLIDAEVTNGHLTAAGGLQIAGARRARARREGDRRRPPRAASSCRAPDGDRAARGRVVSREALGDETIYVVETEAGLLQRAHAADRALRRGAGVAVRYQGAAPPVYDPETGKVVEPMTLRDRRDRDRRSRSATSTRSRTSTSTSPRARSSCCSARPAPARRRRCA